MLINFLGYLYQSLWELNWQCVFGYCTWPINIVLDCGHGNATCSGNKDMMHEKHMT